MLEPAEQAQRSAAQAKRIPLAGGGQADAPDADDRFGAIRHEEDRGDRAGGSDRGLEANPVLAGQGLDHLGGFRVALGVIRAHHALQFGKFADHVGRQIGLAKKRRPLGQCDVRAQCMREPCGNRAHALHALKLGAELVVINDRGELLDTLGQRGLAIGVEEELRVGQARAHHAFVAFNDRSRVRRRHVADDQEPVRKRAGFRVEQREVFLVQPHGQDQALLRHLQEPGLECADIDCRRFDQCRDLIEQGSDCGIVAQGCVKPQCLGLQQRVDTRAALVERCNDMAGVCQLCLIGGCIFYGDRLGVQESVPMRCPARSQAEDIDRDHFVAPQRDERVGWSHESHRGDAIGQLVAHDLRDRQCSDRRLDRRLQRSAEGGTGRRAARHEDILFAVGFAGQGRDIHIGPTLGRKLL